MDTALRPRGPLCGCVLNRPPLVARVATPKRAPEYGRRVVEAHQRLPRTHIFVVGGMLTHAHSRTRPTTLGGRPAI